MNNPNMQRLNSMGEVPQYPHLNSMGQTVGKPTSQPTSRIGQKNQKQVSVLYGHNGSGKAYTYLASENVRTGDLVTPEVTHSKSGKDYKTMARVISTRDSAGNPAQDTAAHLSNQGILLKTIGETNQKALPGFKSQKDQNPKFTAKQWEQESKQRKSNSTMRRLNSMGV